jgi:hypothetical protein
VKFEREPQSPGIHTLSAAAWPKERSMQQFYSISPCRLIVS